VGTLRAAAGMADITPPIGTWMTGYGVRISPATGIHDPIMARAVLLDDGATPLAIVSCDVMGFEPATVADIRERSAQRCRIPGANVLICCTHTHTGPAAIHCRYPMGNVNEAWLAETTTKIADLVASLPARLTPARLACASRTVTGIGFNRQDDTRPIDDELIVVAIDSAGGAPVATLLNYATHAVILGTKLDFSGDFPGAAARHCDRLRGGTSLYLQGASGDAEPCTQRELGWGQGTFAHTEAVGARLAQEAIAALAGAPGTGTETVTIRVASRVLGLPMEPPPSREQFAAIQGQYEQDRQKAAAAGERAAEEMARGMLEWAADMERVLSAGGKLPPIRAELFVAAVGDLRLVAVPFEPYSGVALALKERLRPLRTLFVGYANGLFGYLPTAWAKQQGGYGPGDSCRWFPTLLTPLQAGADEIVITEAVRLAQQLGNA